ncbi:VOC family protein [Pseudonocardia sp. TRM90224]|uniref:VOC family protein n=1 Tax=Pseudonocardia sp. TRM90224 TaxID=2812678 RepID=UPI001E6252AB|nr:VOC family protein [Pseudonocardia sp. TRM90224]
MRSIVHFEIPADDVARAKAFYGELFGWQLSDMPGMDYTIVQTTETDETSQLPRTPGAINGGLMPRTAETPAPVLTVDVESVADSLKEIEAAGGSIVRPRTEIPGMGAFAYFKDPDGNVLGLWENL